MGGRPRRNGSRVMANVAGVTRDVLPLFDACAIRVVIDTVVPLCAAPRAQELLKSKQTVGKLILDKP